jgi:hypothetical protein
MPKNPKRTRRPLSFNDKIQRTAVFKRFKVSGAEKSLGDGQLWPWGRLAVDGGETKGGRARNFLFSFFLDSYILIVYRYRHDESGI